MLLLWLPSLPPLRWLKVFVLVFLLTTLECWDFDDDDKSDTPFLNRNVSERDLFSNDDDDNDAADDAGL